MKHGVYMIQKKPTRRNRIDRTALIVIGAIVVLSAGLACYFIIPPGSIADDIGKQATGAITEQIQNPRDTAAEESRIRQRFERLALPSDLNLASSLYEAGSSGYPGTVIYTYTTADTISSYENLKSVLRQAGYEVYVGADNSAFSASKNSGASLNVSWADQTIIIKAQ